MLQKKVFLPNKDEERLIRQIANRMRKGMIPIPGDEKKPRAEQEDTYLMWGEDGKLIEGKSRYNNDLQAPKMRLPDHLESYNPPPEYLSETTQRFNSLREVPAYENFLDERYERCVDLYLAPRYKRIKNVVTNPEAILPVLPKPEELRPYPEIQSLVLEGHTDLIRKVSLDPTGKWIASGGDDHTVRLWETETGRCTRIWTFEEQVNWVEWNPNPRLNVLAVACKEFVYLIMPPESGTEENNMHTIKMFPGKAYSNDQDKEQADDDVVIMVDYEEDEEDTQEEQEVKTKTKRTKIQLARWKFFRQEEYKEKRGQGIMIRIEHHSMVKQVSWQFKGDYFCALCPASDSLGIVIHQFSTRQSQKPFRQKTLRKKGQKVVRLLFHPTKPLFVVVFQRSIKLYNLLKQKLWKMMRGVAIRYISSVDVHPNGGHLVAGGFDKKVQWWDLELSKQSFKTLRGHQQAVRAVQFHKRYPLFASSSDDGTIQVFHQTVFDDWLKDPVIVPLKTLRGHARNEWTLGVMDFVFHPTQPWIISAGADRTIRVYTS